MLLGVVALAGCIPSTFVCEGDEQCSRTEGGRCEANGACSYPTDGCESGRRYSALGRSNAGECVPIPDEDPMGSSSSSSTGGTSTGSESTGGGLDTGGESSTGPGLECDEPCSGQGRCVLVDGEPTCACDPGWWMVGLECLDDPCDSAQCYFVDSLEGDDAAPGTRDEPWQTQARAWEHLGDSEPGDHVLFRRGREYPGLGAAVNLTGSGTALAPIVVGAYGPRESAPPALSSTALRLFGVEHVVIRDLTISGTNDNPCVLVQETGFFTIHDAEIVGCGVRGFRISEGSHHTVVFRNDIHDVGDKTAVWISDITWQMPVPAVGSHHWVADNVIRNNGEDGIDVTLLDEAHERGDGDVKVVGNQVRGIERSGICVDGGTAWVLGNISVENGDGLDAEGDDVWIEGNVVALTPPGLILGDRVTAVRNTVYMTASGAAVRFDAGLSDAVFRGNLVFGTEGSRINYTPNAPAFAELGGNVYAGLEEGSCVFLFGDTEADLGAWQAFTELDASSRCEVVPGLEVPSTDLPVGNDFWTALAPDATWDGCGSVGAVRCGGSPKSNGIEPLVEVDDNGGLGWEGPLLIRQHYPL